VRQEGGGGGLLLDKPGVRKPKGVFFKQNDD
jgi:hypothetical protein